jgi:hypothetical protein
VTVFSPTGTGRIGDIQDFTVPSSSTYGITAIGAAGGAAQLNSNRTANLGGAGTSMYGEFDLTAGHVIRFVVGQEGGPPTGSRIYQRGGGGGGATFVYNVTTSTLLMVAGGGGGAGNYDEPGGTKHANLTADGSNGTGTVSRAGVGGVAPNGGTAPYRAGAGGGYSGDGESGSSSFGGLSFLNGAWGGPRGGDGGDGGYGGGGGSRYGAGGGGGYGGGGAGGYAYSGDGGGGGSYNAGLNQTNIALAGTAAGSAEIVGLNALPTAPTILTPADNATVALTSGLDFTYTHNDPDGDAQVGYALKRRTVNLGTGAAGLVYGTDEWWDGTAWVGTETAVASTAQPISTSGWPTSNDTYQYGLATSDAVGLGAYSDYRTVNPYEWWDGTAWVLMVEVYVASTASEVTLSSLQNGLEEGFNYDWTVSHKDDLLSVGPYASMYTFTAGSGSLARIWNGTAWADHEILVRSASGWVKHDLVVWDGTAWVAH